MRQENYLKAFFGLLMANRPRYGGYIVHIGIVLIAVGVVGSTSYNLEKEVTLNPNESASVGSYTLTYESRDTFQTASKQVDTATVAVYKGGKLLGRLVPEKYFHINYEQAVTEVAIRSTLAEDLYIILIGWDENNISTSFKFIVNPLVSWLWIGSIVMVAGGIIAWWPQRQRLLVTAPAEANGVPARSRSEVRRG